MAGQREYLRPSAGGLLSALRKPVRKRGDRTDDLLACAARRLALEVLKDFEEHLDIETARSVAERCTGLLGRVGQEAPEEEQRLIQAAALYFLMDDDAESDIESPTGFLDDEAVVEAAETVLGGGSRKRAAADRP